MTTYDRSSADAYGRAAFAVALLALLPAICVAVMGFAITSWSAETLRQNPDALGMVSSDVGEWAPMIWGAIAAGIPAAAVALGLGLSTMRRTRESTLAQAGAILAVVMLVLGLVGVGVFVTSLAQL